MTNLTKIEREILLEVEAELLADIEMLEEHSAVLRDLNNKNNLHKNDLSIDILKAFNRKIDKQQAMLDDIKDLENEYRIKIEFKKAERVKIDTIKQTELDNFFTKVHQFSMKNIDTLYSLKWRWADEKDYEDFEDYKKVIINLAKKSGLIPYKISKSFKISFKFNENTLVNIYLKTNAITKVEYTK